MRSIRGLLSLLLAFTLSLAFAQSGAISGTEYPITIQHALGTTVITQKPERVATVNWANHEVPLALGAPG